MPNALGDKYFMPDEERRLMQKIVADDASRIEEYAFLLQYIFEHMPRGKSLEAFRWLVRNKITGRNFLGFYFVEAKESPLHLLEILTAKILRSDVRPLIFGKDLK